MSKSIDNDPRIGVTHERAICCECATVRLRSEKSRPRNRLPESLTQDPRLMRRQQARGTMRPDAELGWRMVADMKCETCRAITRHALLRDCNPKARDMAEKANRPILIVSDDLDRQMFEDEKRRLEGFGIEFEFRDDSAYIVSGEPHFYDLEQSKIDGSWLVRMNPNLTWHMLYAGLRGAWNRISDYSTCEALPWKECGDRREAYFSVGSGFWEVHGNYICGDADTWAQYWALLKG